MENQRGGARVLLNKKSAGITEIIHCDSDVGTNQNKKMIPLLLTWPD